MGDENTRVCPNFSRACACFTVRAVGGREIGNEDNDKLSAALDGFELLLAAATALVRARTSRPALLDAYDDASERLIDGLRLNGVPGEELQKIHKAIARLRLAFEENP